MSIVSSLLRFARRVVQNVMSQLDQQMNVVQEQAYSPIQAMVQEVVGGAWTGKGADQFVEELSSLIMPNTTQITNHISKFNKDVQHAIDVIDQADEQVTTAVNALGDVFGGIF